MSKTMQVKQAVIECSFRSGVTKAAIRYKTSRKKFYRWRKKYDGTILSLADRPHRPHNHPNQHAEAEIKLIMDMRRRKPNPGLAAFWAKLCQRGYIRSIFCLYQVLRRVDGKSIKLQNSEKELVSSFFRVLLVT